MLWAKIGSMTIREGHAPRSTAFALAFLLFAARAALAQDVSSGPLANPAPTPHSFFDGLNVALTAVETAALTADGITTQHFLTRYPDVFYEGNPLARPFVSRGWPGQIAGGSLVVAADVGVRYLLHRKKHHRLERWVPIIVAASSATAAIHNWREIRRERR